MLRRKLFIAVAAAVTTVTLALGDALAVALLDLRGFKEEDFARSHPGGALGRRLLTHVRDVMRSGADVPKVQADVKLVDALLEITQKGMGMTAIVDADDKPIGVFTDGDLRRMIEKVQDFTQVVIRDVMHANPRSIAPEKLAVDAVAVMEQFSIVVFQQDSWPQQQRQHSMSAETDLIG